MELGLIGVGVAAGAAAVGAAIGASNVIARTLEGIARQPEAKNDLRGTMFIGIGLVEAMPILTWVLALLMFFMSQ
jgi:F-type H+-transporting ATPase subunit c